MSETVREIPLTQGKVAIVDAADYELVSQYKWYAHRHRHTFYARRNLHLRSGLWTSQCMHQLIVGTKTIDHRDGDKIRGVDHCDGDGLNNTRANLRLATPGQNSKNLRSDPGTASQYVGVYWDKSRRKWAAEISSRVAGKKRKRFLGRFDSEEDAARARDKAAFERDPEYCHLNFPEEYGRSATWTK